MSGWLVCCPTYWGMGCVVELEGAGVWVARAYTCEAHPKFVTPFCSFLTVNRYYPY